MKKLPIGIQTFEEIINGGYLYVDKTKQIYDIVTGGKTYFISRPRRFGKSLLCSTLEEVFKGNKELFKGLWIYDSDYDWEPHPVIRIDMSKIAHKTPEELELALHEKINTIAERNSINITNYQSISGKFEKILYELSKKNKVAIIIDEYDKPILDNITNIEVADKVRDVLRNFYTLFKNLDQYLKFIFLTGVTQFSKTSIFSGLNNLKEISLNKKYADLLGYTQEELESFFKNYIIEASKELDVSKDEVLKKLKHWYNGYCFVEDACKVYNPFSILLFFDEFKFKNYWFKSGTPTFLMKLIKEKDYDAEDLEVVELNASEIDSFDVETLPLFTTLFQTGYLTIVGYDEETENYKLSFPNEEVRKSFLQHLLASLTKYQIAKISKDIVALRKALQRNDIDSFVFVLKIFFANIPYTVQDKQKEQDYQFLFYAMLKLFGFAIIVEEPTNIGRIDAVITMNNYIYIFEFKINQSAQKALQQIEDKKYYEKYLRSGKKIVSVGINFDTKEKNISGFEVKEIE